MPSPSHGGLVLALASFVCGCDQLLDSPAASYDDIRLETNWMSSSPQIGVPMGQTVALDETTIVASAPFARVPRGEDYLVRNAGALFVFEAGHSGAPTQVLTAPNADPQDGTFESAMLPGGITRMKWGIMPLAIDADWIVAGMPGEDSALAPSDDVTAAEAEANNDAESAGAVFVYARSGSAGPEYLKAPHPAAGDLFGFSVAVADGWIAVGAVGQRSADRQNEAAGGAPSSGAVYVYRYDDERRGVMFRQFLKAPGIYANDMFGSTVAIEGDLMVVSAVQEDGGGVGADADYEDRGDARSGAVYTYRLRGDEWELESYLKAGVSEPGAGFGSDVALFDGRIAVSAPFSSGCPGDDPSAFIGVVYVISQKDGVWSDYQCLNPPSRQGGGLFGYAIGMNRNRLAVGAAWDSPQRVGAVYTFERDESGAWKQRTRLVAPDRDAQIQFGTALAVGSHALAIGAFGAASSEAEPVSNVVDDSAAQGGAIYLYSLH